MFSAFGVPMIGNTCAFPDPSSAASIHNFFFTQRLKVSHLRKAIQRRLRSYSKLFTASIAVRSSEL